MIERRVCSADQTSLAVYESGNSAGPTVLAVHGYPDNHSVWDALAAELGDRYRVVCYDVRGTGESDKPRERAAYRMPHLVDDLVAVVDAVSDGRPVHLLAHDWGSVQSWPALTDPRLAGRIASFTSISGPSLEHTGAWIRTAHKHPLSAARQLAHSFYIELFLLPRLPELAARRGLLDRAVASANARSRSSVARADSSHRTEADKVNGLELYRANIVRELTRARPKQIDLPVFVIAPARDAYLTSELSLQAPVPFVRNLSTRTVAGGHWVVNERPDVIARCVDEFVGQVEHGTPMRSRELVLVTGAARGLGRATALEFAGAGADVVLADVDEVGAKDTAGAAQALGVDAWPYHLDDADLEDWDRFATLVCREHGVPNVVVNVLSAGFAARIFARHMVAGGEGGHLVTAAVMSTATARTLTNGMRAEFGRDGVGVTVVALRHPERNAERLARRIVRATRGTPARRRLTTFRRPIAGR